MLDIKKSSDFNRAGDDTLVYAFYDIDYNFNQIELYNAAALDQSIENILLTQYGERMFNFTFGTVAQLLLFSNNTNTYEIRNRIYADVEKQLPIIIDRSTAEATFQDDSHVLTIHFRYTTTDGSIVNHEFQRHFKP